MKCKTTLNYYEKIRLLVTPNRFNYIKHSIQHSTNEELEAFWNIVVAGYPIDFAVANFMKLYEYLKDKSMDYSEALDTYLTYPGLGPGIYMAKTRWYELN